MGKQNTRILNALLDGEKLTSLSAWKTYSVARLAARISELREQGYPIISSRCVTENQFGEPTHYFEYFITAEEREKIINIGEMK